MALILKKRAFKKLGGLVLFSVIQLTPICAEESIKRVRILTSPKSTQVYLDVSGRRQYEKYLGLSDQSILLDLRKFEGSSGFNLILRKKGYFDKHERVSVGYFLSRKHYPEQGKIHLEAESYLTHLRVLAWEQSPLLSLLSLCGLACLLGFRGTRTKRKSTESFSVAANPNFGSTAIGPWILQGKIGQGGTSIVYKGHSSQAPNGPEVAIKVFKKGPLDDSDFKARFFREAELYSQLLHPNIAAFLDWGQDDETYYLVTDYIEGEELSKWKPHLPDELDLVISCLSQIALALTYAHGKGIIHRDVKPENLLRNKSGEVYLLDFGLARKFLSSLTQTGRALGTPVYMSPEQILGERVDHRCDQYSLGAIAFLLLTGEPTFSTEEPDASPILFQQVHQDPPQIHRISPQIPQKISEFVARLLERQAQKRFPNMKAVITELEGLSANALSD